MSKTKDARTLNGVVVSNKMDKTITVQVERLVKHPLYGKYMKCTNKIHAHDAENVCQEGDLVTIEDTRPISKSKAWKLSSVDRKTAAIQ